MTKADKLNAVVKEIQDHYNKSYNCTSHMAGYRAAELHILSLLVPINSEAVSNRERRLRELHTS